MRGKRSFAARSIAALLASLMAGCATTPRLDGVAIDGERLAELPREADAFAVRRAGAPVAWKRGLSLEAGDWIATGPRAYAVIRFPSGTRAYLEPDTQAHIGSLFGLIGGAFSSVRGIFAVETEFVEAGAEGTRYLVRASPDGETAVVVHEGTVRVSSRQGAWPPIRLGAGERLLLGARRPPSVERASPAELHATEQWVRRLDELAPPTSNAAKYGAAAVAGAVLIGAVAAAAASRDGDDDDDRDRSHEEPRADGGPPAPAASGPGRRDPDQPDVRSCAAVVLAWRPVAGAASYQVLLEQRADWGGGWQRVSETTTDATNAPVGDLVRVGMHHRWRVRAIDARGRVGEPTPPLYFDCTGRIE